MLNTNNQGVIKNAIGRQIRIREGMEKVRADVMKAYSIGKKIKINEVCRNYGLPVLAKQFMLDIGAIEDQTPENTSKKEGQLIKWIYNKTENGVPDTTLIEKFTDREKEYNRQYLKQKREGALQVLAIQEKVLDRLPTKKDDKMDMVAIWLKDKMEKNAQVHGYLRADEALMYQKMIDVIDGLKELSEVMKKINL